MDEERAQLMHEILEDFWIGWVELVNRTAAEVPCDDDEMVNLIFERMQEKATVYGAILK